MFSHHVLSDIKIVLRIIIIFSTVTVTSYNSCPW